MRPRFSIRACVRPSVRPSQLLVAIDFSPQLFLMSSHPSLRLTEPLPRQSPIPLQGAHDPIYFIPPYFVPPLSPISLNYVFPPPLPHSPSLLLSPTSLNHPYSPLLLTTNLPPPISSTSLHYVSPPPVSPITLFSLFFPFSLFSPPFIWIGSRERGSEKPEREIANEISRKP